MVTRSKRGTGRSSSRSYVSKTPVKNNSYTLQQSGLNVRKGRGSAYSVYKYDTPLFTGLASKEFAQQVMNNQYNREKELRNN